MGAIPIVILSHLVICKGGDLQCKWQGHGLKMLARPVPQGAPRSQNEIKDSPLPPLMSGYRPRQWWYQAHSPDNASIRDHTPIPNIKQAIKWVSHNLLREGCLNQLSGSNIFRLYLSSSVLSLNGTTENNHKWCLCQCGAWMCSDWQLLMLTATCTEAYQHHLLSLS